MIDLVRALAAFAAPPAPEHDALAAALGVPPPGAGEHTEVFLLQLHPYASAQLGASGMLGGDVRDRVAGFLRALGIVAPPEPDHLVVLLDVYAQLLAAEQDTAAEAVTCAREALLAEHLLPWVPALLRRVGDVGIPSYRAWAALLDEVLAEEAARTPQVATLLPVHLDAAAPPLVDPRQAAPADDLLGGLLVPGRSGVILTASDLAAAAVDLGLGRRIGERRFVLRGLLDQDGPAVLGWLADAAARSAGEWTAHWLAGTPTGDWWRERAQATAALLHDLADDAVAVIR